VRRRSGRAEARCDPVFHPASSPDILHRGRAGRDAIKRSIKELKDIGERLQKAKRQAQMQ